MSSLYEIGVKSIDLRFDEDIYREFLSVQGDTQTRGFEFTALSDAGQVIDIPALECRLYGVNSNYPDKTVYTRGAYLGSGRYRVMLSTDMVSKRGKLKLQVALYQGTTALIQSKTWEIEVTESLANGGSLGSDLVVDFTKLSDAIVRVEALEGQYLGSLEDQELIRADVTAKHTAVTSMHASLKTVFDSEAARVSTESARKSAETNRVNAENARTSQESARKTAETNRVNAENTRIANENARKSEETARINAETNRVTAEGERVNAESGRISAENGRVTEEGKRQTAETSRIQQYQDAQTLLNLLGDNPTVELAQEVLALQGIDDETARRMIGVSHLIDTGRDLIAETGILYRKGIDVISGDPYLSYKAVGYTATNDAITHTINSTGAKVLLFFKAQADAEGNLLIRTGEDKNLTVVAVGKYTKNYVIELNFETGDSRQMTIVTVATYNKAVRVWDFAELEV